MYTCVCMSIQVHCIVINYVPGDNAIHPAVEHIHSSVDSTGMTKSPASSQQG